MARAASACRRSCARNATNSRRRSARSVRGTHGPRVPPMAASSAKSRVLTGRVYATCLQARPNQRRRVRREIFPSRSTSTAISSLLRRSLLEINAARPPSSPVPAPPCTPAPPPKCEVGAALECTGLYDTAVQRGSWSCSSNVVLQVGCPGKSSQGAIQFQKSGRHLGRHRAQQRACDIRTHRTLSAFPCTSDPTRARTACRRRSR